MKKGITPVIAIILLLLLTISMVGFAFVWFNRVVSEAGANVEDQTLQELNRQGQRVRIENIQPSTGFVTIRNTGTVDVTGSSIILFENNGVISNCVFSGTITPGSTATSSGAGCNSCVSGTDRIKVTAPGGIDEAICPS